jgi:hypothetical protein
MPEQQKERESSVEESGTEILEKVEWYLVCLYCKDTILFRRNIGKV